ncbi:NAD(P)/FAD-dependent oxidoreductase [Sphingomonas sp. IC4-52]|uniref:NAD(P)/FAD-dependent oxidoreductase n=1 Tax=Sphingomonas sp. IC4-52 TaxID=2887202 RepID=UPI001D12D993|nr:FAD-dependent monooxygenase [Sphingomonas sp. IC4-52]MCC2981582.1 FAD-dependent monooxygenase [Sphingomonas sp. IC4-52]
MRRAPALIVGGGPAGATLALRLACMGIPHLLVERTRETPDALCGGFLSWHMLAMLERLGIEGEALNPLTVTRVRLMTRGAVAEAPLPSPARAVSRRRLDSLLLAAAEREGAMIERGIGVRGVTDGVARLDDGACIGADTLFLASGKHDTRGLPRPPEARGDDPTLGIRVRLAPGIALDRLVGDAIELHLMDGGYAGLVRQEDGSGNLCMAVRRSRLQAAGTPDRLLDALGSELPALGERLALREPGAGIDAVANVPYGWRATSTTPGVFRLGDQAGVIPSLAGEGMAIAVASALAAADAYRAGGTAAALSFQRQLAERLRRPIGIAAAAWHVGEQPWLRGLSVRLARLSPALLPLLARATRV